MSHVIVAFVADLMFQTRIESVVEQLDMQVKWVERAEQAILGDSTGAIEADQEENPTVLFARIKPKLLIFDMGNKAIPWMTWIPIFKASPGTRDIPIVCFGSHVDVQAFKQARQVGADEVLARSRFVTALPDLIMKYTKT